MKNKRCNYCKGLFSKENLNKGFCKVCITTMKRNNLRKQEMEVKITKAEMVSESIDTYNDIIDIVSQYYGIDKKTLYATGRRGNIVKARHVCYYFFKQKRVGASLQIMADMFGQKSHANVIYAINNIGYDRVHNIEKKHDLNKIEKLINKYT